MTEHQRYIHESLKPRWVLMWQSAVENFSCLSRLQTRLGKESCLMLRCKISLMACGWSRKKKDGIEMGFHRFTPETLASKTNPISSENITFERCFQSRFWSLITCFVHNEKEILSNATCRNFLNGTKTTYVKSSRKIWFSCHDPFKITGSVLKHNELPHYVLPSKAAS